MATIIEELKRLAQDYANNRQSAIAQIDNKLATIEQEKLKLKAERDKAHSAIERASEFPIKSGADYPCPIC